MRDIRFREWDQAREDMMPGHGMSYSVRKDSDDEVSFVFAHYESDESWENNHRVLEQYTGVDDVRGKPIYEGDIVHGYDQEPDRDDGYIGSSVTDVVNFKYGAFWIGDSWYKVMVMTPPIVEVIGNIHENPELLEEVR